MLIFIADIYLFISKLLWSLSDIALVDGISRPPGGVLGIVFN